MKSIKTSISSRLVALLAGAALFGLVSQSALALTASGTTISNMAKLGYTVGAVPQNEICSSTTGNSTGNGGTSGTTCVSGTNGALSTSFVVDDKVIVTVAGGVQTPVTPGQLGALTPFTVTNNGNATQGYNLVAANAASGAYTVVTAITDNFDPVVALTIYRDNNCNGAIDGTDAIVTTIPTLAVGTTACLLVSTNIPLAQLNGDAAVASLQATTVWPTPLVAAEEPAAVVAGAVVTATVGANTAGIDVVLADAAGVIDNASDGKSSTYGAYKVSSAVLSVSKVATLLCDPINGNVNPKNIPGAAVQYAVTITNASGGASATLTTVTDTLVAALGFDPKLISGVGAPPITTCTSAGGASLSASGFGAVYGTGTTVTTYAAPGLAGQAVTAGAAVAAGTATITYGSLAGGGLAGFVGGVLPANSFITVYFNAFVQ